MAAECRERGQPEKVLVAGVAKDRERECQQDGSRKRRDRIPELGLDAVWEQPVEEAVAGKLERIVGVSARGVEVGVHEHVRQREAGERQGEQDECGS